MTEEEKLRLVREIKQQERRHLFWPLTSMFVSMFVAVAISMSFTWYSVHQYEQTWCELVAPLDDQYKMRPPTEPAGIKFAEGIHHIRVKFHCR